MKLKEIITVLETWAPVSFQDDWDNSGLILGDPERMITGIMICLDTTMDVLQEARVKQCNLVISHHPLIFKGLKSLTPAFSGYPIIQSAIRDDIAIYAIHTNMDNRSESLNHYLGIKIGLEKMFVLRPRSGYLRKLVTFCPVEHAGKVREALFSAGAGHIGNYDCCSFNSTGQGSFRASEEATPFVGERNELHFEDEVRIEVIFPMHIESNLIQTLILHHPYEEVAYDIYPLMNSYSGSGAGIAGTLREVRDEKDFLDTIKDVFKLKVLRHSLRTGRTIKQAAICSGAGSFLLQDVIRAGIDAFLTGDLRYHDFQEGEGKVLLVDIGHYESEHFMKEFLHTILIEKIPNFAILISEREKNPVNYL